MKIDTASKFEQQLAASKLILPGERVFVACSGGPDSVALFHLLIALRQGWRLKLGIFHYNHGLRGRESDRDEQFVRRLAKRHKVPCVVGRRDVRRLAKKGSLSIEEAARRARYDFFLRAAKRLGVTKMASAHHQDDQAETVLMRIIQGTGIRGLSGILGMWENGRLRLVRPMLGLTRKEILDYLAAEHLSFRRDKSNESTRFIRNRIRKRLLPFLEKEFNPKMKETLARIPDIVQQENAVLAELEDAAWKRVCRRVSRKKVYLNRERFLSFPAPLQFRILNRSLAKIDPRSGLNYELWRQVRSGLRRKKFRWSMPRDIDFFLTHSTAMLCKK